MQNDYIKNINELNKMNKAAGLPEIKIEQKFTKASYQQDLPDTFQPGIAEPEPKPRRKKANKSAE